MAKQLTIEFYAEPPQDVIDQIIFLASINGGMVSQQDV